MNFRSRVPALSAIFLGIGILMTCILPAVMIVAISAITIIVVGVMCLRC